ncbi:MAG: hypothetical protein CVU18_13385 [Betaproteobacteria bacterium HGW-Betaproteobacteria-12]|nr:MAG: hypothetical protein CVU18_13385 [Betaproteobacteria bacterium HGW-Betaproteobacteria-12]
MRLFLIAVLTAAATGIAPAGAADVGVSVSIGQPGFFGRLDIGDYPPPQLIYQQPRMVRAVPVDRPPIYLNVPPGHAKNWRRYCRRYDACDDRVYFVRNTWYEREYVPHYQRRHVDRRDGRGNDGRWDRRDEHRGDRRDNDHERGRDR